MISRQGRQWPVGAGIAINSPDCHKQAQGLVRLADCLQTSCTRHRLGSYQSSPAPQDLQTINIKTVGRIQIKFLPPPPSLVPRLSPDLGPASGWWRPVSRQHKLESPWGTKKVTRYSSWLQLPVDWLSAPSSVQRSCSEDLPEERRQSLWAEEMRGRMVVVGQIKVVGTFSKLNRVLWFWLLWV